MVRLIEGTGIGRGQKIPSSCNFARRLSFSVASFFSRRDDSPALISILPWGPNMKRFAHFTPAAFVASLLVCGSVAVAAAADGSGKAPDFPPGSFSDGNRYSLEQME